MTGIELKAMTYNIAGGNRKNQQSLPRCIDVIAQEKPGFVALQEATRSKKLGGKWTIDAKTIAKTVGYPYWCFDKAISLESHFHIGNTKMVDAIFNDMEDVQYGSALLSSYPFLSLDQDLDTPGKPRWLRIFNAGFYAGNRDSESRYVWLARLKIADLNPYVVSLHLSTLIGERGVGASLEKQRIADGLRLEQLRSILDLLREKVLRTNLPLLLLGDFNVQVGNPEHRIIDLLERQERFVWLKPNNEDAYSHLGHKTLIDHLFAFPVERIDGYTAHVVDSASSRMASDHLPVTATITWR